MKRKVTGLFLTLVLLLSLCLVAVTPVVADDVNVAHSINVSGQFEGYLGYLFGLSGDTIGGNIEVLDDGTVKGYIYSLDLVNSVNGVFAASWQLEEVIEAAIVEVDGKSAVLTLNKTVACGTMIPCNTRFPVDGNYWIALIVDGDNPGSGEDYILGIEGIQDKTEAKSMYDDYLATGDTAGLSPMDIVNCNVVIK